MWSTPLAQKGFLRICAQTRRDLSLVYNNPQWRIQGRDPGGGAGVPFTFRPKWGPKGRKKIFFWDRDSPLPSLPPPPISGSGWPRLNKTDRHSHDYEGQESSKLRNTKK